MSRRYSHLIPIFSLVIDLTLINAIVLFINDKEYINLPFLLFANSFWILSTIVIDYYKIDRQVSIYKIFSQIGIQAFIYSLGFFSYFAIFREGDVVHNQFKILTFTITGIAIAKLMAFYALRRYRSEGMNYRNIVFIGYDDSSRNVIDLFKKRSELGYRYKGFFSDKEIEQENYLGSLKNSLTYIKNNDIDEVFCSVASLKRNQIKKITKYANENNITVKLIPEANELYNKNVKAEYYDNTLILNVKKLPLEIPVNRFIKRSFDIAFSLVVLVFIMSWLTPILALLIKLESKGPVFFKQEREGLVGANFTCYKFRSMRLNTLSDKVHASKNDNRVTKLGAFLRKTSIDESPQFFNVLKGDMSVVGPRPHMGSLAMEYQKEIDNYMERHAVKPGITGLAQVSGYRGEVLKKSDIKNRIRFDIFYIENWSLFLDMKIILNTVFNVFKGDAKAY